MSLLCLFFVSLRCTDPPPPHVFITSLPLYTLLFFSLATLFDLFFCCLIFYFILFFLLQPSGHPPKHTSFSSTAVFLSTWVPLRSPPPTTHIHTHKPNPTQIVSPIISPRSVSGAQIDVWLCKKQREKKKAGAVESRAALERMAWPLLHLFCN